MMMKLIIEIVQRNLKINLEVVNLEVVNLKKLKVRVRVRVKVNQQVCSNFQMLNILKVKHKKIVSQKQN